jgi:hypothetical protein
MDQDQPIHKEKIDKNKALDGKWVPWLKILTRWNRSAESPISASFLIEVTLNFDSCRNGDRQ